MDPPVVCQESQEIQHFLIWSKHTWGLPLWFSGKETACSARDTGDTGLIPGWEDPLEEGMATHCSVLTWRIPRTEDPGGLQSMVLQRIGHDWSDWADTQAFHELFHSIMMKSLLSGQYSSHSSQLRKEPQWEEVTFPRWCSPRPHDSESSALSLHRLYTHNPCFSLLTVFQ